VSLNFNPTTAKFTPSLITCVPITFGGAHNSTIHPGGDWLTISNCCSGWSIDVIDLRQLSKGVADHRYRLIDATKAGQPSACPKTPGTTFQCVVMQGPGGAKADGQWRPHDIHYSADGRTMYVAAINSTFVVDVSRLADGQASTISIIPNLSEDGGLANPRNIATSHQSDITPDGKILVISDERGGGLNEIGCNKDPNGIIGGLHFWALAPVDGLPNTAAASPANPVKMGVWFYPNPLLATDPLQGVVKATPRSERACTVHVFRIGGNGSSRPGPAVAGMDGVSALGNRELVAAHYGAGVWHINFSQPPTDQTEDPRSTWGQTQGFNVQPGADTWSAKEYRGYVYAGDMLRGIDIYRLGR
jgi:hypothetical protein